MEKLIEINNLSKHYSIKNGLWGNNAGFVYALNNVYLDIYKNEVLGLVGESGSGKSTLGNCILKLITPTGGEVLYNGENILNKSKKELKTFRKKAQLIFQNPYMSLNPRMRIREILTEPLIIHGIKNKTEIEEKLHEIISLIGFKEEILSRYPHEFSGGQRQRIAIARALILNPDFIVADEPVSALDVSIQAQIINLLSDLKNQLNLTMLFISHDLSVVKYISDRIAVMYLGEIVEIAPKDELFKNHKHPYTRALLNAVPKIGENSSNKDILKGDLPSVQNLPSGCKFHTRCPYVTDICRVYSPDFTECSHEHKVRCFLACK